MNRPTQLILFFTLFIGALVLAIVVRSNYRPAKSTMAQYVPHPQGTLTFNKDIAPIVFRQCAACHRPGQSAPFSLLNYEEVKKRAKQISEVTAKRIMPPWLPEPGYGEFADARLLSVDEIGKIGQWVSEGALEGDAKDLPEPPKWTEGWQLGEPDLVVKMPEAYTLRAEGKDVYRNFVVAIPVSAARYVKAVEFQPGNPKIVHHAFIRFDKTAQSRRLDEKDAEPGFSGIHTPETALSPEGHFLSWQPGKVWSKGTDGLAWTLERGTDLVLQVHMQPSGKQETLQSAVGFYCTDKPAANAPLKIGLSSYAIDIPAGEKEYTIRDSYVLPVDMDLLGILPHAHYLGKECRGYATLPDGTKKWLLLIKHWDFNWQGDYRYVSPMFLPKGTTVVMEFTYDNSAENERNPNRPPKRVQYGLQSTDEMAELWLRVLLRNPADSKAFAESYQYKVAGDVIAYNQYLLRQDAKDAKAHTKMAKAFMTLGKPAETLDHLRAASAIDANDPEAHYFLGIFYRQQTKPAEAKAEFETVLRLDPDHSKAHGNLGLVLLEQGNLTGAEIHFQHALRLNPEDMIARESLNDIARVRAAPQKSR